MISVANSLTKTTTLNWLESVLHERFGLPLLISLSSTGTTTLRLEGRQGLIEFSTNGAEFDAADLSFAEIDMSNECFESFLPGLVPAPGHDGNLILCVTDDSVSVLNYNIVALVYWMLNRVEELNRTDLDDHNRFSSKSSHAFLNGYLSRPVVDEWLFILGQVIVSRWPGVVLRTNNFEMKVSHDVDMPGRYAFAPVLKLCKRMCGDLLRGNFKGFFIAPVCRIGSRNVISQFDPANTFEWLMDVSERLGITSAFYFICGRTDASLDADYEIEHPAMRSLLRQIHARGHEIGLHPSYNTYNNPARITSERRRLQKVCEEEGIVQAEWGGRMHYLRWEHPTTLVSWDAANLSYDSTLGYADAPGFRCGTCFEYPGFDPVAHARLAVRVRPLIAMEVSIIDMHYLGLGVSEAAFLRFKELKDICRAANGNFTVLWHNSHFCSDKERDLYERVLSC